MSGWFRVEAEGHERTMVALAELGVEVPRDLALMDLRYYQNLVLTGRRRSMPSRAQLMDRWHWKDKRVRLLLADEPSWTDPSKAEAWAATKGPAEGQRGASEGPAEGQSEQGESNEMAEKGPAEGQRGASEGPAEGHRRVVGTGTEQEQNQTDVTPAPKHPGPSPLSLRPEKPRRSRKPKAPSDPAAVWAQQWVGVWDAAWKSAYSSPYPWDFFPDRARLVRAAGAVGAHPDQPVPPEAHQRLGKAIGAYLDAAERGEAWPPEPPTVQGFVVKLGRWIQQADRDFPDAPARASPPPDRPPVSPTAHHAPRPFPGAK